MRARDRALADAGVKRGIARNVRAHDEHGPRGLEPEPQLSRFDAAVLRVMIPHHQGAVVVAKAELTQGLDPKLRGPGARQREMRGMREHPGDSAAGGMHGSDAMHD